MTALLFQLQGLIRSTRNRNYVRVSQFLGLLKRGFNGKHMSCVATSGVATALPRVSLSRALLTQCHVDLCATLQRLLRPSRNATWRFFNRRKWRFASPDRENARGAFGANAESPRLTLSLWRVRGKDVSGLLPFLGGKKKKGAGSCFELRRSHKSSATKKELPGRREKGAKR